MIRTLHTDSATFDADLLQLLSVETVTDSSLLDTVNQIIDKVRQFGDAELLTLTQKFDQHPASSMSELELSKDQLQAAYLGLSAPVKQALEHAAARIKAFHERQLQSDIMYTDEHDNLLGQRVTPLEKAGVYVPGGLASYPSSVLMNVIPAKVAGVKEVVMVVPAPKGELNPLVLAAAHLSGVDKVFTVGGAQAVAALAYGTESVPKVDKITGPGNRYVAAAKRQVFGVVGIDMIAGPSEILIYADQHADPEHLAADFLSQAEHDTLAQSILITTHEPLVEPFCAAVEKLLATLPKADIARESIKSRGAVIVAQTQQQALDLINQVAPEHLELCVQNAQSLLPQIKHAGAIFLGYNTPEAVGDYCAGPNHVLPTSGTARFSSPLGVYDFQKRTSIIGCSKQGGSVLAKTAQTLALEESLHAHAASAALRITDSF